MSIALSLDDNEYIYETTAEASVLRSIQSIKNKSCTFAHVSGFNVSQKGFVKFSKDMEMNGSSDVQLAASSSGRTTCYVLKVSKWHMQSPCQLLL